MGLLLLLCGGPQWGCRDASSPLTSHRQAIIGGQPSLEHPAVGALQRDGIVFCTGTLISPSLVLTAGHCIDSARIYARADNQLRFRIDVKDSAAPEGFRSHYFTGVPERLETHPRWQPADVTQGFDLGLVVLSQSVPETIATPIPFNPTPLEAEWQSKPVLFLGYGLIFSDPYAVSPNQKHGLTLPISQLEADRIKVGAPGQGLCHGDSGGPALAQINGAWRVIAVNSFGDARRVSGSSPARSRCDQNAYCFRTDLWKGYLEGWVSRLAHRAGASCQSDADCGSCGACDPQSKACTAKIPLAAPQCKRCRQDTDCGQGLCLKGLFGRYCAMPCDAGLCCPSGTTCGAVNTAGGTRDVCLPTSASCFAQPCTTDGECGVGASCQSGACTADDIARTKGLCFPCKATTECGGDLTCEPMVQGGRCVQACDQDGLCPRGFTCQQAYPGSPARCLPTAKDCPMACTLGADCPPEHECQNGLCAPKAPGKVGESCTSRSCESGLECITTLSDRRCYKPCHVPPGEPNGACIDDRTCAPKTHCTPVRGVKSKFCLPSCATASDCPFGGKCVGEVCICREDNDCSGSAYCENTFGGDTGFCVDPKERRPCGSNETCTFFLGGSYCVPTTAPRPPRRLTGQTCDELESCHPGLQCVEIRNGAKLCIQPCNQSSQCTAGGRCEQNACLCTSAQDCPKGRVCQLFLNLGRTKYGVCTPTSDTTCVLNGECGPGFRCNEGSCVVDDTPEPSEETTPEPAAELSSEEPLAAEPTSEPTPADAADQSDSPADRLTPDPTSGADHVSDDHASSVPGGGCGCHASLNASIGHHERAWWWMLVLFVFLIPRRRQDEQKNKTNHNKN